MKIGLELLRVIMWVGALVAFEWDYFLDGEISLLTIGAYLVAGSAHYIIGKALKQSPSPILVAMLVFLLGYLLADGSREKERARLRSGQGSELNQSER